MLHVDSFTYIYVDVDFYFYLILLLNFDRLHFKTFDMNITPSLDSNFDMSYVLIKKEYYSQVIKHTYKTVYQNIQKKNYTQILITHRLCKR